MNTARVYYINTGVNNVKTGKRNVNAGERNVGAGKRKLKTGLNIQAARRRGMARGFTCVARARDPLGTPCRCGFSRTSPVKPVQVLDSASACG